MITLLICNELFKYKCHHKTTLLPAKEIDVKMYAQFMPHCQS